MCTNPVLTDMVTVGEVSEWPRIASIPQLKSGGESHGLLSQKSQLTPRQQSPKAFCCGAARKGVAQQPIIHRDG